jgi:hypothetical protein
MRAARLQDALQRLTEAIQDVESELAAMKAEHDPLASHIFVSRRHYRGIDDTKSGKRRSHANHCVHRIRHDSRRAVFFSLRRKEIDCKIPLS